MHRMKIDNKYDTSSKSALITCNSLGNRTCICTNYSHVESWFPYLPTIIWSTSKFGLNTSCPSKASIAALATFVGGLFAVAFPILPSISTKESGFGMSTLEKSWLKFVGPKWRSKILVSPCNGFSQQGHSFVLISTSPHLSILTNGNIALKSCSPWRLTACDELAPVNALVPNNPVFVFVLRSVQTCDIQIQTILWQIFSMRST